MANNVILNIYEIISDLPVAVDLPLEFGNASGYVIGGGTSTTRNFRIVNSAEDDSGDENNIAINSVINVYPVNEQNVACDPGDGSFDPATQIGNGDQVAFHRWLNVKCTTLQRIAENEVFEGPGATFTTSNAIAQDGLGNYLSIVRKSVEILEQAVTVTDMGGGTYIVALTNTSVTKYSSSVIDGSPIPILYVTQLLDESSTPVDISEATIVYNIDSITITGVVLDAGAGNYTMSYYILENMVEGVGIDQYSITEDSEETSIVLGAALVDTEFVEVNYITDYSDLEYVAVGRRYFPSSPTIEDITAYIGSAPDTSDIDLNYIEDDPNGLYEKNADIRIFNTIKPNNGYADVSMYLDATGSTILEGPDNFEIILGYQY